MAYGSNINLKQMAQRCPTASVLGGTILNGYQLLFKGSKGSAVATIEKQYNGKVPVLLWDLKAKDEASLDRYEGYPRTYGKQYFAVTLNGKSLKAMAYIMKGRLPLGTPSRRYYDTIKAGYQTAGFNTGILDQAVRASSS